MRGEHSPVRRGGKQVQKIEKILVKPSSKKKVD